MLCLVNQADALRFKAQQLGQLGKLMLSSVQAPVQNLCVQVLAKMSQGVFFPCGRHQASSTEMSLPFTTSLPMKVPKRTEKNRDVCRRQRKTSSQAEHLRRLRQLAFSLFLHCHELELSVLTWHFFVLIYIYHYYEYCGGVDLQKIVKSKM